MSQAAETTPSVRRRAYCAAVSSASDEPLAATASRIDHWILLEYRGLWDRDVLGGSLLSPELKAHLRGQLRALGNARLLFLKRPDRRAYGRRHVFFGSSRPGAERLFELEVDHQQDLLGFDFARALAGGATPGVPVDHPLLAVCTHGKRDRCCAKQGRPLYDALCAAAGPGWVWQSTHVGGDRFAGNVVVLPHGLYYGRVEPDDVPALLAAHAQGRVDLDRYRGRSAYPFPVQAAEHAIRESHGLLGIDDLAAAGSERLGPGAWRVRFRAPDGSGHEVDVVEEVADEPVFLTCGAEEPKRARRYVAAALRPLTPR
ncbi:MAG TPA: sucrase ferredoxin [Gaiellaceae bacterium]|nr:sucrase ferredoxin [Gaiellaceae bacterium]